MNNFPKWLFNESVPSGVDYTDKQIVSEYDNRHESFRNYAQEAQSIANILSIPEHSSILDIGCGTGGLTIHLAAICKHVYAVDVSEAMLGVLEDRIAEHRIKNITTVQSGFLTYQNEGESFDRIVANINLHHLPDFWKQIALCRLFDLLKNGGRMFLADVVFSFEPREYFTAIESWLGAMQEVAGPKMVKETVVHVRDEYSTWEWIMSGMIERAGFRIDSNFEINPNIRAYVCSK